MIFKISIENTMCINFIENFRNENLILEEENKILMKKLRQNEGKSNINIKKIQ